MKDTSRGAARRTVLACIVTSVVMGLMASPAAAANYWGLRHDGVVPANQGAWSSDFVSAESAGNAPLVADRTSLGQWETFDFVIISGQWIALKAKINGKYVTRQANGVLQATSTTLGQAQYFYVDVSNLTGGHFRLIHGVTGSYVRLDAQHVLWADATHFSAAGTFLQTH